MRARPSVTRDAITAERYSAIFSDKFFCRTAKNRRARARALLPERVANRDHPTPADSFLVLFPYRQSLERIYRMLACASKPANKQHRDSAGLLEIQRPRCLLIQK